jgi:hypothetical protein
VQPGASRGPEDPELAAKRAEVVERLRKQTELAHERLREARERMQQQAQASGKAAPAELLSQDPPGEDHGARTRRARANAWHGMMHRVQRPAEIPPEMRQELREHARRIARLHRIRTLARERQDEDALNRANVLVGRELARNRKRMAELWQAFMQHKAAAAAAAPPAAQAADEDEQDEPDPEDIEEEEAEDEEGVER